MRPVLGGWRRLTSSALFRCILRGWGRSDASARQQYWTRPRKQLIPAPLALRLRVLGETAVPTLPTTSLRDTPTGQS